MGQTDKCENYQEQGIIFRDSNSSQNFGPTISFQSMNVTKEYSQGKNVDREMATIKMVQFYIGIMLYTPAVLLTLEIIPGSFDNP